MYIVLNKAIPAFKCYSTDEFRHVFLPVLGLVLGAPVPGGRAILLGTFMPLGLAVLMFPPVIWTTRLVFVPGYRLTPDHQNHCLLLCDCNAFSLSAPKFNKQKKEKKKEKKMRKREKGEKALLAKRTLLIERGKNKTSNITWFCEPLLKYFYSLVNNPSANILCL